MREIWLVTGHIARSTVESLSGDVPGVRVVSAGVTVASFMTRRHLLGLVESNPGMAKGIIIVPGTVRWDVEGFGREYGLCILKGPRNLNELPGLLSKIADFLRREPDVDASQLQEFIKEARREKEAFVQHAREHVGDLERVLRAIRSGAGTVPSDPGSVTMGEIELLKIEARNFFLRDVRDDEPAKGDRLIIGRDFPPLVMAEVIGATEKSMDAITKEVDWFIRQGAQLIDIGGLPGRSEPGKIGEILEYLTGKYTCPFSIDSLDEREIIAAIENGAEMILSIDMGNRELLHSLPRDRTIVVIPTDMKKGYLSLDPGERANIVADLVLEASDLGFSRILADPIINSPIKPGFVDGMASFIKFHEMGISNEKLQVPFFIGGSNVTEMIDTDSQGINALLAIIGVEIGAGVLFTTEDSAKCLGSVGELIQARDLAFTAKIHGTYPKDLGIDAFRCKSKSWAVPLFDVEALVAGGAEERDLRKGDAEGDAGYFRIDSYNKDPSGVYFKIMVEPRDGVILVASFRENRPERVYKGDDAELLTKAILLDYPDLIPTHVAYLGREIGWAQRSLESGAIYIQDDEDI